MKNIFNRFWKWVKALLVKPITEPEKTIIEVPWVPEYESRCDDYKKTRAYADQRQKAPKNRKRHESKRLRNIYKLN
jgi:hypothetical protein